PFVVGVYNLDPSLFPEQYRSLAGPIPLFIAQRNEKGEWGWGEASLKDSEIPIGIYIEPNQYFWQNQLALSRIAANNFNSVVVPYFWHVLFPRNSNPDSGLPETYLRIANNYEISVFPTPIVWQNPNFLPSWFKNNINEQTYIELIRKTLLLFPQNVEVIQSINEPYGGDFLFQRIPNYPEIASEIIREERPNAIIILNNFDILIGERNYPYTENLALELKEKGLLDGIGIQLHLDANYPPSEEILHQSFESWRNEGFVVYITELSITNGTPQQRALLYQQVIRAARESGVTQINLWGLGQASWRGSDSTLFDNNLNKTLSYYSSLRAILGP
ncbi:MAG: endo-1,4-beta-xylanase, partial [Minisyncoccales bacterium]